MPIEEALDFFQAFPPIERHLRTLVDVGLGYVRLGQPATTLAARRSASSSPPSCRSAAPAAPFTFSTSPRPGCTSKTSASCSACFRAWRTAAAPRITVGAESRNSRRWCSPTPKASRPTSSACSICSMRCRRRAAGFTARLFSSNAAAKLSIPISIAVCPVHQLGGPAGINAQRDRRPFSPAPFLHHASGTRVPSRSGSGAASRSRAPVPRRDPNRDGNRRPARVRSH